MSGISNKVIKPKLGLLELAKQLSNVSQACKVMGYSRDTFYRYKDLYEHGGENALHELTRRKDNPLNRVADHVEEAVLAIAIENPALGQERVANELHKKGIIVSGSGVRSIWKRNDLESFNKRLKALEAKSAQDGLVLTEEQLQALERGKKAKEAHGEIVTEHPGYLGSQDTYYVGNMKGVGRIYQQTYIDTYCKVAMVNLYNEKTAITAAHLLNAFVVPWYNAQEIELIRMLTDRGTEYCGKAEQHAYQLFLAIEDIEHTKTQVRSPQTNGICERFHRTMKEEFYDIAFRKKIYTSVEQLLFDANEWLKQYNNERPHSGKYCYGKTPMETFAASKHLAQAKNLPAVLEQKTTPRIIDKGGCLIIGNGV